MANAWRQKPIRYGDKALVDEFRRIRVPTEKLRRMNDVRLYLKVTYLSCMTNVEGNKIERWALYGPPRQDSELEWPVRRKPLPENIREWRHLIYKNFTAATGLYPANLGSIWRAVIRVIPVLEEEAAQANV